MEEEREKKKGCDVSSWSSNKKRMFGACIMFIFFLGLCAVGVIVAIIASTGTPLAYMARISFFGDSITASAYADQVVPDEPEHGYYKAFVTLVRCRAFVPQLVDFGVNGAMLEGTCNKLLSFSRQERCFFVLMAGFNDVGSYNPQKEDVLSFSQRLSRILNDTLSIITFEHPVRPIVIISAIPPLSKLQKTPFLEEKRLAIEQTNRIYRHVVDHWRYKGLYVSFCDIFKHLSDGNGWRVPGVSSFDEIHFSDKGNAVIGLALATSVADAYFARFPGLVLEDVSKITAPVKPE